MDKIIGIVLLVAGLLAMPSCSSLKPGCLIQDKLAAVASDVVVSKLQCSNAFAVKADIDELVKGLGLCKTGQIADMVCPGLVDSVVDKVVNGVLPEQWGCTAQDAKDKVKEALLSACKQIPLSQWKPE